MRIAIVHNLPSGGAKRVLHEHVKRLRQGHHLELFRFDVTEEKYFDLTPAVAAVHTTSVANSPLGRLRYRHGFPRVFAVPALRAAGRDLARRIDDGNFDLAFVHGCNELNSPYALKYLKTPTLYFCQQPYRGLENIEPAAGVAVRRIRRLYADIDADNARHAHYTVAPSYFCREQLFRSYGFLTRVSHLGVDEKHFRPLSVDKRRAVAAVGSLGTHKAQDFLIRSVSLMPNPPDVWLVYNWSPVGQEEEIRKLASRLGVTVRLMSGVSDDDLLRVYNEAAIVVSTSIMELFGLTAIEAMSCGAAVIAVNEGGYRESVVHDETGWLVERDEQEFADALSRLIDDRAQQKRFGDAAREIALQRWTWDRAFAVLEGHVAASAHAPGRP